MDSETPPTDSADLDATTPVTSGNSPPPAATPAPATAPFKPIPTSPLLNASQGSAANKAVSGIQQSFAHVGEQGTTLTAFNAIYGTGQLSGQPSLAPSPQNVMTPQPPAFNISLPPSPALGAVNPANTNISPIVAQTSQPGAATISDKRAKTNIQNGKKDIYSFLNYLNKGIK